MAGRQLFKVPYWPLLGVAAIAVLSSSIAAQPRESSESVGGVTFDPARPARIRTRGGQIIRGELIGVSEELVHFRISSGKEFQYKLSDIRSIATNDGDFRYASAYDTYRELVENARKLEGVTIDAAASVAGTGQPPPLPRPPAPSLPTAVEFPEVLSVAARPQSGGAADPRQVPAIPVGQPQPAPGGGAVSAQPFYESNAFRVSFIAACLAIIGFWWRNRVG